MVEIARAGIDAAAAPLLMRRALEHVPQHPALLRAGPIRLVAAGKAAAAMAATFAEWAGARLAAGVVAAPVCAHPLPLSLTWCAAGHPLPNEDSLRAGYSAMELAASAGADGVLACLLSGGASALLVVPAQGLDLTAKIEANRVLLEAGAEIHDLNCVRKHLSQIKGGRLAARSAADVVTLAISDVVAPAEDDPSVIGSGPTVADPTTFRDAVAVVRQLMEPGRFPAAAWSVLTQGVGGELEETPKSGDPRLARATIRVIGNRRDALDGAAHRAVALGYSVSTLETAIVGAARSMGADHVDRVLGCARLLQRPACVLSAGETTVRVAGSGRGGRNQEFALAAARALDGQAEGMVIASVGTDGIDGPTDAAGAIADNETLARAKEAAIGTPEAYLAENNSYAFFDRLGDLIRTGPTDTNVGDLQVALIT